MPLTSAEKQKRYRERLKLKNPEKFEIQRTKQLERVKKNYKKIEHLTESEKKQRREQWKKGSKRLYDKATGKINPENTPIHEADTEKDEMIKQLKKENKCLKLKIEDLTDALERNSRNTKSVKKQLYRLKQVHSRCPEPNSTQQTNDAPPTEECPSFLPLSSECTPIKRTEMFVERLVSEEDRAMIRPKILELNVLSAAMEMQYKNLHKQKDKQILKNVVCSPQLTKYKIKGLHKKLGLKSGIKKRKPKIINKCEEIMKFFLRDDNSRNTAGKKECVSQKGLKMQKRFLIDHMTELYKKYKQEGGKASYTKFRKNRPFYVCIPKLTERDTCSCIKHSNYHFKVVKLFKLGLMHTSKSKEVLQQVACNIQSKSCMYNECHTCKDQNVPLLQANLDEEVSWIGWTLKTCYYSTKNSNEQKSTKKYIKEVFTDKLSNLIEQFQKETIKFKKHFFNMNHQHEKYRECIDNLKKNEAAIICDFSENYLCKYHREIQAVHFGGSRNQITLHTGVLYTSSSKRPFCTISPSNDHSPAAIWAHLRPIIDTIKTEFPTVEILHFFSDGPATQYRQKNNFFLLLKETASFTYATWSFFEASHGKGAADGIGGAIKRTLDNIVAFGSDVTSAINAYELLKQRTSVQLFYIKEEEIQTMQNTIPEVLPLRGTMSLHQIITAGQNKISHRVISCFCGTLRGKCSCYEVQQHTLYNVCVQDLGGPSRPTKKRIRLSESEESDSEESEISYAESSDSPQEENDSDDSCTVYCYCKKGSFGNMIACDNAKCRIAWFHYSCVGVSRKPKGKWFCADCIDSE